LIMDFSTSPALLSRFALYTLLLLSILSFSKSAEGSTINVAAGGDFQAALNNAQPGDTILLQAGATYTGPFTLPYKSGTQWITIRTSSPDSSLPTGRISPSHSHLLAKIVSNGNGAAALQTAPKAHHYRILGLEIAQASADAVIYDLVKLGDTGANQDSMDEVPHNIVIDRCYIHAYPGAQLKRGIALNSAQSEILNSYLEGFKAVNQDSQAICGWNGPGPFKIINNYLEGAGENVMYITSSLPI
jgi:hypothetical protein